MCQFFDKLGYPVSFAQVDHYHAQKIDRQSALPKAQKENGDRIQFTHISPHNHAVKSIVPHMGVSTLHLV